ncbi:MAG: mercuric transporter MerT family protein [Gammaproteobacteria bacterium]|nr:mercuric transporter MerT family protein [Gammaproteobacteria bacterium]
MAVGGIVGAVLASSCCILPLLFLSLGMGGAWMGNLTAMAPYQPIFTVITFGFLGYGYYLVYWKSKADCVDGDVCARPISQRIVKVALIAATLLVLAATAVQYIPTEYLDFLIG